MTSTFIYNEYTILHHQFRCKNKTYLNREYKLENMKRLYTKSLKKMILLGGKNIYFLGILILLKLHDFMLLFEPI